MNSLLFSSSKIVWGFILLGVDLLMTPRMTTIGIIFTLVVIDFITGIAKAKIQKVARTSEGYRRTIIKVLQYLIIPVVFWLAGYYVKTNLVGSPEDIETMKKVSLMLEKIGGWLMLFIIYIEVTSIFENVYEIDKKGMFAKLLKPILAILKFGFENNPIQRLADKLTIEAPDAKVTIENSASPEPTKVTVETKPDGDNKKTNYL